MGMVCYPEYAQDLGEFCNLASGSSTCGDAGTYTVSVSQDIPAQAEGYSSYFSMATVKLLMNYDAECARGSGNSGYFMMGVAAVPAVGIAALFMYRRRRRPLIVLNEDETDHNFVEMNNFKQMNGAMA